MICKKKKKKKSTKKKENNFYFASEKEIRYRPGPCLIFNKAKFNVERKA